jgi:hypothetical protein
MEGPMDKFVRKRKTDDDETKDQNTNQETKKEEKSPLKVKKNIETKDEKMTDIIKEVPKKQWMTRTLNFIQHMSLL